MPDHQKATDCYRPSGIWAAHALMCYTAFHIGEKNEHLIPPPYTDLPPHTQNINTHTTQPPRPHLLGSVCVYHFPSFILTHDVSQESSFVLYRWRNIFIRWGQGSCHKRHRCLIDWCRACLACWKRLKCNVLFHADAHTLERTRRKV